jgi:hypothetical protein
MIRRAMVPQWPIAFRVAKALNLDKPPAIMACAGDVLA